jgi:hypothetical protein
MKMCTLTSYVKWDMTNLHTHFIELTGQCLEKKNLKGLIDAIMSTHEMRLGRECNN